jgi:WD40 repeat protein
MRAPARLPALLFLLALLTFPAVAQLENPEPSHQDTVYAVDVTSDGARLVSGSADGTIMVWDTASGNRLLLIEAADGRIRDVDIDSTDESIVAVGDDGTIREWDLATGALVREFTGRAKDGSSTLFVAKYILNDTAILVMSRNGMLARDRITGQRVYEVPELFGNSSFHPDGTRALTVVLYHRVNEDGEEAYVPSGRPVVWDLATGAILQKGNGIDRVGLPAYSADGAGLFYVVADAILDVRLLRLDPESFAVLDNVPVPNSMTGEAYEAATTPDGRAVVIGLGWPNVTVIYDAESLDLLAEVPEMDKVLSVAIDRSGAFAYTGNKDGGISQIDLESGEIVRRFGGYRAE